MLHAAPRALRLILVLSLLATASCRWTKTLAGRVLDYDTRRPIGAATIRLTQSGWGVDANGLVWDKDYSSTVTSDANGRFVAHYTVGDAARVVASADGYSEWRNDYPAGGDATIFLRRRPETASLRLEQMSVGVSDDGRLFGWSFATRATVTDEASADLFPVGFGETSTRLQLAVGTHGGIRFLSGRDLGVDRDFLIFAPPAPTDGYAATAIIELINGDSPTAGAYFVRTGDGAKFAKFEVGPSLTTGSGLGVKKQIFFLYVFDPEGGRTLPFSRVPPPVGK
jgi:hypothetical protein